MQYPCGVKISWGWLRKKKKNLKSLLRERSNGGRSRNIALNTQIPTPVLWSPCSQMTFGSGPFLLQKETVREDFIQLTGLPGRHIPQAKLMN